jgi:hypothetical protein
MKQNELKDLIKIAVREAIQEELKDILLEAVKSNKQPVNESYQVGADRTLKFNSSNVPTQFNAQPLITATNPRQSYMDILAEMSQPTPSGFEGDFKVSGEMNTMSEGSSLPGGQLGLDQIMNLIKK